MLNCHLYFITFRLYFKRIVLSFSDKVFNNKHFYAQTACVVGPSKSISNFVCLPAAKQLSTCRQATVYLPISICLSTCLSNCLPICLSPACLSAINLPVCVSAISLPVCLLVYMPVYLPPRIYQSTTMHLQHLLPRF